MAKLNYTLVLVVFVVQSAVKQISPHLTLSVESQQPVEGSQSQKYLGLLEWLRLLSCQTVVDDRL